MLQFRQNAYIIIIYKKFGTIFILPFCSRSIDVSMLYVSVGENWVFPLLSHIPTAILSYTYFNTVPAFITWTDCLIIHRNFGLVRVYKILILVLCLYQYGCILYDFISHSFTDLFSRSSYLFVSLSPSDICTNVCASDCPYIYHTWILSTKPQEREIAWKILPLGIHKKINHWFW